MTDQEPDKDAQEGTQPTTEGRQVALVPDPYMNAPEMRKVNAYDYNTIDQPKDWNLFSKEHNQMIYGVCFILTEKFWDMGALNAKLKPFNSLKKWFIKNTKVTKPNVNSMEDLLRAIIAYVAMVNPSTWNPPTWQLEGIQQDIPLPILIMKIWSALVPQQGIIKNTEAEVNPLQLLGEGPWFDGDVVIIKSKAQAHSAHITAHSRGITEPYSKNAQVPTRSAFGTKPTPRHQAPISEDSVSDSEEHSQGPQLQCIMDALTSLQAAVSDQSQRMHVMEHKELQPKAQSWPSHPDGGFTSQGQHHHSQPPPRREAVYGDERLIPAGSSSSPQSHFNLELLKVVSALADKGKDKDVHTCKGWEETILPRLTAEKVCQTHDHALNTYGQRAAVSSAKALLLLYDLHWSEETNMASLPKKITPDSMFHELAVLTSQAIQHSLMTHAFPKADKPQHKERKQLLAAVMGPELTAKDLQEAYPSDSNRGRGRGGSWRGGKGGKGRGRGRGRGGRGDYYNNNSNNQQDSKSGKTIDNP